MVCTKQEEKQADKPADLFHPAYAPIWNGCRLRIDLWIDAAPSDLVLIGLLKLAERDLQTARGRDLEIVMRDIQVLRAIQDFFRALPDAVPAPQGTRR